MTQPPAGASASGWGEPGLRPTESEFEGRYEADLEPGHDAGVRRDDGSYPERAPEGGDVGRKSGDVLEHGDPEHGAHGDPEHGVDGDLEHGAHGDPEQGLLGDLGRVDGRDRRYGAGRDAGRDREDEVTRGHQGELGGGIDDDPQHGLANAFDGDLDGNGGHGSAPESSDQELAIGPRSSGERRTSRRLPGGRVVVVSTLIVITAALSEVVERERIGMWTGVTLIVVSAVAALITQPGDRSLPAMMPPLAFVAAVAVAGQNLLNVSIDDPWQRQAVMMVETLGENASWVVAATGTALLLALIGHLVSRRRAARGGRLAAA